MFAYAYYRQNSDLPSAPSDRTKGPEPNTMVISEPGDMELKHRVNQRYSVRVNQAWDSYQR